MKKIIALIVVLSVLFISCSKAPERKELMLYTAGGEYESGYYRACTIRVGPNGEHDLRIDGLDLPVFKLDSASALNDFVEEYGFDYGFAYDKEKDVYSYASITYDEKFFENKSVMAVYFKATEAGYSYDVYSVAIEGKKFSAEIRQSFYENDNVEKNNGHLAMIGVLKDDIKECNKFRAVLGEKSFDYIEENNIPTSVPDLTVDLGDRKVTLKSELLNWNYKSSEQHMVYGSEYYYAYRTDGERYEDAMKISPSRGYDVPEKVKLCFDTKPYTVNVSAKRVAAAYVDEFDNIGCKYDEQSGELTVLQGGVLYEVSVRWNDENYNGYGKYTFYIDPREE